MKSKLAVLTLVAPLLGGCSTMLNSTAPAAQDGYVYAVGARQTFIATAATVWLCPTQAASPDPCQMVDVTVTK